MRKRTPFLATLKQICNEYHKRISELEATKIDIEYEVAKKDHEVRGDDNHSKNCYTNSYSLNNSRRTLFNRNIRHLIAIIFFLFVFNMSVIFRSLRTLHGVSKQYQAHREEGKGPKI